MFVADILINALSPIPATAYKPFIYAFRTNYISLKTEWGSSCDDIFNTSLKENAKQVTENYLSKLIVSESLNDCIENTNSFYFDSANQTFYVHISIDANPLYDVYDYGYAFGVCTNEMTYIGDEEYLPIVTSYPEIEIEDDATGQSEPTGIVASITMGNMEYENTEGRKEGVLDFLVNGSISCYGNDVYMYDYDGTNKTLIGVATIKNVSTTLQKVTLSLKDERM